MHVAPTAGATAGTGDRWAAAVDLSKKEEGPSRGAGPNCPLRKAARREAGQPDLWTPARPTRAVDRPVGRPFPIPAFLSGLSRWSLDGNALLSLLAHSPAARPLSSTATVLANGFIVLASPSVL